MTCSCWQSLVLCAEQRRASCLGFPVPRIWSLARISMRARQMLESDWNLCVGSCALRHWVHLSRIWGFSLRRPRYLHLQYRLHLLRSVSISSYIRDDRWGRGYVLNGNP